MTQLLSRVQGGDDAAANELLPLLYTELRGLARAIFSAQGPAHTLQPTALVHEAWLKLADHLGSVDNRHHFFALAGRAMRQVVVDHARGKSREKRGGGRQRVTLDTGFSAASSEVDLIDLDDSLRRLAERNEKHARVAELRLFGGLTLPEVTSVVGGSQRAVESDWAMARAWLLRELAAAE